MALITPKCIFYDIEGTGGSWVRQALRVAGLSCGTEVASRHAFPIECQAGNRLSFCFIRHPLQWYEAYFRDHLPGGERFRKQARHAFEEMAQVKNFGLFLQNISFKFPGYVTNLYKLYTGVDTEYELNFIGRYENIKDDLIHILKKAEEDFDEQAILDLDLPEEEECYQFKWPKNLYEKMIIQESFALARFNYVAEDILKYELTHDEV